MKRSVLAGLGATVVLGIGAGAVGAHTTAFVTDISANGSTGATTDLQVYGEVDSPRGKCVRNRTVKIIAEFSQANRLLVDTDRTSTNGFFSGGGDFSGAQAVRMRATSKDIAPGDHVHRCKSAFVILPLP
jgi:hypothetical protein